MKILDRLKRLKRLKYLSGVIDLSNYVKKQIENKTELCLYDKRTEKMI